MTILTVAQPAGEFRPGFAIDPLSEARLKETSAEVLDLLRSEPVEYNAVTAQLVAARREAASLLAKAEGVETEFTFQISVPSEAPVVVFGSMTPEIVREYWKQQVDLRVNAVHAVLTDGPRSSPLWNQVVGVHWRHRSDLTKRVLPVVEALREAHKDALLLQRSEQVVQVKRGEVLFEDGLREVSDNWYQYGPAETTYSELGMRRRNEAMKHADTMIWTRQEFEGNFLVEFSFKPHNEGTPGALFAICGRPVVLGTDLSVSCGETMDTYNHGVHAYHFSVHRSSTDLSNGRRVGNGLKLICSRSPDPCSQTGITYRVSIGKWGNALFFLVDGQFIHNYYDAGTFGPPLASGSVGMRHWGGQDATYSDFQVFHLIEETQE
jgi:hypothetical protein